VLVSGAREVKVRQGVRGAVKSMQGSIRAAVAALSLAIGMAAPATGHVAPRTPTAFASFNPSTAHSVDVADRKPSSKRRQKPKLPANFHAWAHVATCESGGWVVLGSTYPDSLGINRTNYVHFGGRPQGAGHVPLKARIAQVRTANRLIKHYHMSVPDRGGCNGSW
jgi:hypothetical protein